MLTKLSQWVSILFCSLPHGFLFELHEITRSIKPRRCSLMYMSIRTLDYVILLHQANLSKTTKHWDGFVSHCMDAEGWHERQCEFSMIQEVSVSRLLVLMFLQFQMVLLVLGDLFVVTSLEVSGVEPYLLSFLKWGVLQLFPICHPCSGQFVCS